jgi:hypothetical protein
VALHELLQRLPKGELIADLPVEALFAALPERIGSLNRGDFSTACMRLTVSVDGTQRNIYFDSAPERVCGYLLLKYGVIAEFKEGENLHVCPTVSSRISLDFLVSGQNGDSVFIEYHPLSRAEKEAGLSLEDAGVRKIESVKGGEYNDATVHHIWDVEDLYKILQQCTMKNPPASFEQFRQDIKEAESLGRKLDQEDANQLEKILEELHIELPSP